MRLRDELWFKGRDWFQERSCSMPQDDALIAELTAPTYTFSSTGKMVVESKADMKKRGMRSPDLADAFLLTFACGERRKELERYRRPEPRNYSAWGATFDLQGEIEAGRSSGPGCLRSNLTWCRRRRRPQNQTQAFHWVTDRQRLHAATIKSRYARHTHVRSVPT